MANNSTHSILFILCSSFFIAHSVLAAGDWVKFRNETSARLVADASVGASDPDEKTFAWGDVDRDGDIDLVCARKQTGPTTGQRRNVLFLNEGRAEGHAVDGVLVDRTVEFAAAASDGGEGLLDPTNNRALTLADLDGNGWLDLVTAATLSDGSPKRVSHPRIYRNLGILGNRWAGFHHDEAAIPQLLTIPDGLGGAPRFDGLAIADVTGDGLSDLFFGNNDAGPGLVLDFNDRLLVQHRSGGFVDSELSRLPATLLESSRCTAVQIADMNRDGHPDIVKAEAGGASPGVLILYNHASAPGTFLRSARVYDGVPLHLSVGDLNDDKWPDLVITDAGVDRFLINIGDDSGGETAFIERVLTYDSSFDDGAGGNSVIADLNHDGLNDVIVTDVDAEFPACHGSLRLFRNLGGTLEIQLEEQRGFQPWMSQGVHDAAVFDLNGDGWNDLILGTCTGTEIWINVPPQHAVFRYPGGLPTRLTTGSPRFFRIEVTPASEAVWEAKSGKLYRSIDNLPFEAVPLIGEVEGVFRAALPALECQSVVRWYVEITLEKGLELRDPPGAPDAVYRSRPGTSEELLFVDDMEADVSLWSVENSKPLSGGWEHAVPIGTTSGSRQASPREDASRGPVKAKAFVTGRGFSGGDATMADVDGGPTRLISPSIDLAGRDAVIAFRHWFFCSNRDTPEGDSLVVELSNNGGSTWTPVYSLGDTEGQWRTASFRVGEFLKPTASVAVAWSAQDTPNNSITEAAIDEFQVLGWSCAEPSVTIEASDPPSGAIDARQPTDPNGANPAGWNAVELRFSGFLGDVFVIDFQVAFTGSPVPRPGILGVMRLSPDTVRVLLTRAIPTGAWTTFTYRNGPPPVRLGFLPGDVNGNGVVAPSDIAHLVSSLGQTVTPTSARSLDLDRSGAVRPLDLVRGIDLLVGAGAFDAWNGRSLP